MKIDYYISAVKPYINWDYFFFSWGIHNKPDEEKQKLRTEAEALLTRYGGRYKTHALFLLLDAYSDGDDIVVFEGRRSKVEGQRSKVEGQRATDYGLQIVGKRLLPVKVRIPFLRQQHGNPCLCLSDFVAPNANTHHPTPNTQLGLFATSVDAGMEHDFDADPYEKMMMQLLADRLAEATAERLHKEVRQTYWGYAHDEHLAMDELHVEKFQGIRPAVGYPSLPDASLNFLLNDLLDMRQIGITLTESGAMRPHASVSGLMFSHPQSRYFSVGKIDEVQLQDYARRRGLPLDVMRKFLISNLC